MGAKNVVLNNSWTKEQVSGEIKYWTECKWKFVKQSQSAYTGKENTFKSIIEVVSQLWT